MATNITEDHKAAFEALHAGHENFCLFSCFLNGKPTSVISVVVNDPVGDGVKVYPMFVAVTGDMELTDHDGREPSE